MGSPKGWIPASHYTSLTPRLVRYPDGPNKRRLFRGKNLRQLLKNDFAEGKFHRFAVTQFSSFTDVASECDLVVWVWEWDKLAGRGASYRATCWSPLIWVYQPALLSVPSLWEWSNRMLGSCAGDTVPSGSCRMGSLCWELTNKAVISTGSNGMSYGGCLQMSQCPEPIPGWIKLAQIAIEWNSQKFPPAK